MFTTENIIKAFWEVAGWPLFTPPKFAEIVRRSLMYKTADDSFL